MRGIAETAAMQLQEVMVHLNQNQTVVQLMRATKILFEEVYHKHGCIV